MKASIGIYVVDPNYLLYSAAEEPPRQQNRTIPIITAHPGILSSKRKEIFGSPPSI
jgi:hypothetical protein